MSRPFVPMESCASRFAVNAHELPIKANCAKGSRRRHVRSFVLGLLKTWLAAPQRAAVARALATLEGEDSEAELERHDARTGEILLQLADDSSSAEPPSIVFDVYAAGLVDVEAQDRMTAEKRKDVIPVVGKQQSYHPGDDNGSYTLRAPRVSIKFLESSSNIESPTLTVSRIGHTAIRMTGTDCSGSRARNESNAILAEIDHIEEDLLNKFFAMKTEEEARLRTQMIPHGPRSNLPAECQRVFLEIMTKAIRVQSLFSATIPKEVEIVSLRPVSFDSIWLFTPEQPLHQGQTDHVIVAEANASSATCICGLDVHPDKVLRAGRGRVFVEIRVCGCIGDCTKHGSANALAHEVDAGPLFCTEGTRMTIFCQHEHGGFCSFGGAQCEAPILVIGKPSVHARQKDVPIDARIADKNITRSLHALMAAAIRWTRADPRTCPELRAEALHRLVQTWDTMASSFEDRWENESDPYKLDIKAANAIRSCKFVSGLPAPKHGVVASPTISHVASIHDGSSRKVRALAQRRMSETHCHLFAAKGTSSTIDAFNRPIPTRENKRQRLAADRQEESQGRRLVDEDDEEDEY